MRAILAGFALAMLAIPAAATEHPDSLEEFRCGQEFITLPVDLLNPDLPPVVITVRKSDVIGISARGFIDLDEGGRGSSAVIGIIMINFVSNEQMDASREIRSFRLLGWGTYDRLVACLN